MLPPELPYKTIFAVSETMWVVGLVLFILHERRPPVSTLAWIFGLVLLPFVGIPVYFVFGPRQLVRRKLRYRDKRVSVTSALRDLPPRRVPGDTSRLAMIGENMQHTRVCTATRVVIRHSGDATYDAIVDAVDGARDHVHVEYYIYEADAAGERLRDALVRARKRGVEVRVLVDAVGSPRAGDRFFSPLVEAGGLFRRFQPPRLGLRSFRFFNFRTHRKIVVVDGRTGFTGGMNLSACHSESLSGDACWRDTHLEIEGAAVGDLQRTFVENWVYAGGDSPTTRRYFPELPEGTELVQILRSGPDREVFPIHTFLFAAIATAERRVLLTTPYLVPDEATLAALKSAVLRGVSVNILVPARGDSALVQAAARSYFGELLEAGCKVHTYEKCMLHAKILVVDDDLACVGTANFDNRSFRLNFEVMAVLYGTTHARALAEQFTRDLENASEVKRRTLKEEHALVRLGESAARLASPLL